ncbi:MAG: nuclear transport factor 2 family protein [Phycisphaerales bacterium]|nr:nuclear transport factor 2 family protein [Phycisphaerales bacterium]
MKHPLTVLTVALLITAPNFGAARPWQTPPGHPDVTPQGHPAVTDAPKPPPTDHPPIPAPPYATSVEVLVNTAFETISGGRGEARDWDKYRDLFFPDARLYSAQVMGDTAVVGGMTVDEFIAREQKYLEGSGYFEKPISLKIEEFGHIAQVRSVYESRRRAEDEAPYTRGVYSIQLVESGGRWWILNMLWQREDPQNPIPDEYLQ